MLGDERPQPGEAEHLALRIVGLYQPIAVEKSTVFRLEHYSLLPIAHVRHEPQGHPPSPQFVYFPTMPQVGEIVARVGVGEATVTRVEDTIEAGDEHVGRYVGKERLVDSLKYLSR